MYRQALRYRFVPASHTLGQRYLDISFMIAQSAFLCSLFETVCSASRSGVFFSPLDLAIVISGTTRGCKLSGEPAGGVSWSGGFESADLFLLLVFDA